MADVAVLHNWASMAYSISSAYVPTTLVEQVLIQHKVPWDLLFEEQMDGLKSYGAVILAGQESISNAQVDVLLDYARSGGTLILAGDTARYNEWREERHANAFLPARREGKGRIVVIPQIVPAARRAGGTQDADQNPEPGAAPRKGEHMTPPQWLLPRNHEEIYRTVVDNLPKGLSVTTETPLTTVVELLTRPKTRETIAHFVNFDRHRTLDPFRVAVRRQFSGPVKSATCFSPDLDTPIALKFEETGEGVSVVVPETRLYAMLVLAQ